MKKILHCITLIACVALHAACNKEPQQEQPVVDRHKTIIAYFFGTSLQYDLNNNAREMQNAIAAGAIGHNALITFRQISASKAEIHKIYLDKASGEVQNELLETIDIPDALDGAKFGEYLKKMMDYAPAESYSAIFLGHSTAWLPDNPIHSVASMKASGGFCPSFEQDPDAPVKTRTIGESNVMLGLDEFTDGVASTGVKFDCLYFDVCFMSSLEAVYQLRNCTDHIIASPCEIMGYGSPYERILKPLFDNDYNDVCEQYWDFYANTYYYPSGCISDIDCSKLPEVAAVVKRINAAETAEDFTLSQIQYYEGRTETTSNKAYRGHCFYDAEDYLSHICSDEALIGELRKSLAECVPCSYHTKSFFSVYNNSYNDINNYSGISITPDEKCIETMEADNVHKKMLQYYNPSLQQTDWYRDTH